MVHGLLVIRKFGCAVIAVEAMPAQQAVEVGASRTHMRRKHIYLSISESGVGARRPDLHGVARFILFLGELHFFEGVGARRPDLHGAARFILFLGELHFFEGVGARRPDLHGGFSLSLLAGSLALRAGGSFRRCSRGFRRGRGRRNSRCGTPEVALPRSPASARGIRR